MKRLLITLLALATLALGSAQAQNWIGLRTGYPLGVTAHYGIANALANDFDLRISANVRFRRNDNVEFGLGLDAMNVVAVEGPFEVYIGGGPAIDFGRRGTLIDIHGLLGAEFRFIDLGLEPLGIFLEGTLGIGIGLGGRSSQFPTAGAAFGFNYRF